MRAFAAGFMGFVASTSQRTPIRAALAAAAVLAAPHAAAQMPGMLPMPPPPPEIVYVCPLDRSIRSLEPGDCERRGRKAELVAEVAEPLDFELALTASPVRLRPGEPATVRFDIRDPWEHHAVERFTLVHESLLHAFVVSEDLEYFLHDHPHRADGAFELDVTLPRPGLYRVLADFLPEAATPQLLTRSLIVPGPAPPARPLARDYAPKQGVNLKVTMSAVPEEPVAGTAAILRFDLSPADGIEPYLGVLGHMLIASDDLIDLMHTHPTTMYLGPTAEFSVVFPRPHVYRVWVQFQRQGEVNTVHFDVPVRAAP